MKLEIRNNFDTARDEKKGKISKTKPIMGILIGPCPKWGKAVKGTAVGKNIKEILSLLKVEEKEIINFVNIR
jgi:hypothetical protein